MAIVIEILALFWTTQVHARAPVYDLLQQNRLSEAVAICRQKEVMGDWSTQSRIDCAWVFYRARKIESGDKLVDKLRVEYQSFEYKLLSVFGLLQKGKLDKARETLTKLGERYKEPSQVSRLQLLSGELYEALGQLDTAAFIYKQLLSEKPNLARANWGLGRYYLSKKDYSRAKEALRLTTQAWPKHVPSRYNLAVLAITEGRLPDAARWLAACYRLDRSDVGVLEQLGVLYEKRGNLDQAIRHWQQAVAVDPKTSQLAAKKLNRYVNNAIENLIAAGKLNEALGQIQSSPFANTPRMALRKGLIYRQMGQYELALPELLKYVQTDPQNGQALRELGICYLNLKLLDQAGQAFTTAVNVEPGEGMNYAWLAFALEGKGQIGQAREMWIKAVERLKDPAELARATRRLAAIEKVINQQIKEKEE